MKRFLLIVFVLFPLFVQAENIHCMRIEYKDGNKIMQSIGDNVFVGVVIDAEAEFDKDFEMWINVQPIEAPVVFGSDNIKIKFKSRGGVYYDCDVYSKKEWMEKINKQMLWFGQLYALDDEKYKAERYYLQKTTIAPKDKTELKYVVAKNSRAKEIYVYITIGGETFEFNLNAE